MIRGLSEALAAGLKSLMDHRKSVKYKSTTINTLQYSGLFQGQTDMGLFYGPNQGILKGEVSLYR